MLSRIRSRRGLLASGAAIAVVVAIAALAAPSLGAGSFIDGLFSGSDKPDVPAGAAHRLVTVPVDAQRVASLWLTPTQKGGRCIFVAFAAPDASSGQPRRASGGDCAETAASAAATDAVQPAFSAFLSASLEQDGSVTTLIGGAARRDSHIVRVALRSADAETPVPFEHGWYLLSLPGSPAVGQLPPHDGPLDVVGYDVHGTVVDSIDLDQVASSTP